MIDDQIKELQTNEGELIPLNESELMQPPGPYVIARYNENIQKELNEDEVNEILSVLDGHSLKYSGYLDNSKGYLDYEDVYILPKWVLNEEDPPGGQYKSLNCANEKELYLKLSRVNTLDYQSIIKFYNDYGPLGLHAKKIALDFVNDINSMRVNEAYTLNYDELKISPNKSFLAERLTCFMNEIEKISELTNLWHKICNNKIDELNKNIKKYDHNGETEVNYGIFPLTQRLPKYKGILVNGDPLTIGKIYLLYKVNEELPSVSPHLKFEKNSFAPGYRIFTLIGAVYQQFYELLSERKKLKKCRECGKLYPRPNGYNRGFCPSPDTSKSRSYCENKFNSRYYRWRTKLFKGEATLEQAAEGINITVDELKQLLKKYTPQQNKSPKKLYDKYKKQVDWL